PGSRVRSRSRQQPLLGALDTRVRRFKQTPGAALECRGMYVVAVTICVRPDKVQDFIEATLDNARNTRREPGNIRFDVLRAEDDPGRFMLYEAYRSKDDVAAHQQTAHYARWKSAVAAWMAQPRQRATYNSLFFG